MRGTVRMTVAAIQLESGDRLSDTGEIILSVRREDRTRWRWTRISVLTDNIARGPVIYQPDTLVDIERPFQ